MDAIVFANINARTEQATGEDEAAVESVREFLRRQHLSATVRYVRTIDELAAELTSNNPVALITNFPPNSTYDSAHRPVLQRGPGGMVYASEADSYSTTKEALKGILCNQQNLRTLVVTGAPRNELTDEEIVDTAGRWAIRVVRKGELFTHPHGYPR
jgi:hypothetical protein